MNKWSIIFVLAGIATVAICYYLWFSPLFMLIGGISCLTGLLSMVPILIHKVETIDNLGCFVSFVIIGFLVLCLIMSDKSYISTFGGKRHIYIDCQYQEGNEMHKLTRCSAFLWGCFSECKCCIDRQKEEKQKEKQVRKELLRNCSLIIIDEHIEKLQQVREAILLSEDIEDIDVNIDSLCDRVAFYIRLEAHKEYNEYYNNYKKQVRVDKQSGRE